MAGHGNWAPGNCQHHAQTALVAILEKEETKMSKTYRKKPLEVQAWVFPETQTDQFNLSQEDME